MGYDTGPATHLPGRLLGTRPKTHPTFVTAFSQPRQLQYAA
jgi:hypothetical protein